VAGALGLVFSSLTTLRLGRGATGKRPGTEVGAATASETATAAVLAAVPTRVPGTGTGQEVGRTLLAALGVIVVAGGLLQLVPVNRVNPPVQTTVTWDSPQTQQLWERACADCHSNQTQWPWYTTLAPGSWLTAVHVNAGRDRFNVSAMSSFARGGGEAAQQVRSGAMPLADYMLIHPTARLTDAEKQALIQGLQKSLGQ
jgi:mono/diheme cytochrome c family protein